MQHYYLTRIAARYDRARASECIIIIHNHSKINHLSIKLWCVYLMNECVSMKQLSLELVERLPAFLYFVGLSFYLTTKRSRQEPDVLEKKSRGIFREKNFLILWKWFSHYFLTHIFQYVTKHFPRYFLLLSYLSPYLYFGKGWNFFIENSQFRSKASILSYGQLLPNISFTHIQLWLPPWSRLMTYFLPVLKPILPFCPINLAIKLTATPFPFLLFHHRHISHSR